MKNVKWILSLVIVAILFSGIGVLAASYMAQDVSYKKADGTTIDVQTALNELYNEKVAYSFYINTFQGEGSNNAGVSFYTYEYRDYKYFRISETNKGNSTSLAIEKYNWTDDGSHVSLALDTKYEIDTSKTEEIFFTPSNGYRLVKVEFFKE